MIQIQSSSVWVLISIASFAGGTGWGIALVHIRRRFFSELSSSSSSRGGGQKLHLEEPASFDLGLAGSSPSTGALELV